MSQSISIELPIKTGAGLNDRLHWRQRSSLVRGQRVAACTAVRLEVKKARSLPFPAVITMTRLSFGTLDDDNLQGAFKAIRDGIADAYELPDNHRGLVWRYAQAKCKRGTFGIRIDVVAA